MFVCINQCMFVYMHVCMECMYVCTYVRSQNKACMYFTEQSNAKRLRAGAVDSVFLSIVFRKLRSRFQFVRLVDRLELMRPQGELVPRLCAAIMASTPRSGAAVDRGASVPVSGFQQTQLMHIADSVLCGGSNKSSKGDNTW